jgi:hypothetical protein
MRLIENDCEGLEYKIFEELERDIYKNARKLCLSSMMEMQGGCNSCVGNLKMKDSLSRLYSHRIRGYKVSFFAEDKTIILSKIKFYRRLQIE